MSGQQTPLWERLTELSRLEDGWLDGYGKAPAEDVLQLAGKIATALPHFLGQILIAPTEAGGIQLEWSDHHGGHEIEVMPDLHLFLLTVEPAADASHVCDNKWRDAKERVKALHEPVQHMGQTWCGECSVRRSTGPDTEKWVASIPHPCPTIDALNDTETTA